MGTINLLKKIVEHMEDNWLGHPASMFLFVGLIFLVIMALSFLIFTGISYGLLFLVDFIFGTAYLSLQNALIAALILTILKAVF